MKKLISFAIAFCLLGAASVARAAIFYTGPIAIDSFGISGVENGHFRAYSTGLNNFGCNQNFAYINESVAGSKTFIAGLMTSYLTQKRVNFGLDKDANGFCKIIEYYVGQ